MIKCRIHVKPREKLGNAALVAHSPSNAESAANALVATPGNTENETSPFYTLQMHNLLTEKNSRKKYLP